MKTKAETETRHHQAKENWLFLADHQSLEQGTEHSTLGPSEETDTAHSKDSICEHLEL